MEEIRKFLDGYEISSLGRVRRNGNILKQYINKTTGYCSIILSNLGKYKFGLIHRLVAKAFIPNPKNKGDVNHKNSIRTDNRVENLEWMTRSENIQHGYDYGFETGPKSRLGKFGKDHHRSKPLQQLDDEGNIIKQRDCLMGMNRELGYSISSISNVCNGKKEKAYGYKWRYS